ERLLVVCQPDLRRFARRACSNGEDAEDAVQIALWQLYRKIGALRAAATFVTWMFRIIERGIWRCSRVRACTHNSRCLLSGVRRKCAKGVGTSPFDPEWKSPCGQPLRYQGPLPLSLDQLGMPRRERAS